MRCVNVTVRLTGRFDITRRVIRFVSGVLDTRVTRITVSLLQNVQKGNSRGCEIL